MKTFQEFLADTLQESHKYGKYDFTQEDYEDWVNLKAGSPVIKKIEEFIEDLCYFSKEGARDKNDNCENWYDVENYCNPVIELEPNEVQKWCNRLSVKKDFHTDYQLKKGMDGLQGIFDAMAAFYKDNDNSGDPINAPGNAVYYYYTMGEGLTDDEFESKVWRMSSEYVKRNLH